MSAQLRLKGRAREIVARQVELRVELLTYKDLERQTGLTANYLQQIIRARVRAIRQLITVSRGTAGNDNR